MPALKLTQFAGVRPRIAESALPDAAATVAVNVRLDNGTIRPFYESYKESYELPYATGVTSFYPSDILRFDVDGTKTWALWGNNNAVYPDRFYTDVVYAADASRLEDSKYTPPTLAYTAYIDPGSWTIGPTLEGVLGIVPGFYSGSPSFTPIYASSSVELEFHYATEGDYTYAPPFVAGDAARFFYCDFPLRSISFGTPPSDLTWSVRVLSKSMENGDTVDEIVEFLAGNRTTSLYTVTATGDDSTLPGTSSGVDGFFADTGDLVLRLKGTARASQTTQSSSAALYLQLEVKAVDLASNEKFCLLTVDFSLVYL